MNDLEIKALTRLVGLSAFVGAILMVAGGPDFWEGWRYWFVLTLCYAAITLFFLQHDPDLIGRRILSGAEKNDTQQMIRGALTTSLILLLVTAGVDHRQAWSDVPAAVSGIANVVVIAGFAVVFLTFLANSHAGATVDVSPDQQVVDTGPYAWVRHPMYFGLTLILLGTPFALGSEWAFPWALVGIGILAWRLMEEEKFLSQNLVGYDAYRRHTRFRLIPYIW